MANKKRTLLRPFFIFELKDSKNYLFITYMVTSKPKRISVAAGVVHMVISFVCNNSRIIQHKLFCIEQIHSNRIGVFTHR